MFHLISPDVLPIVVYDNKYPDRIEMTIYLTPGIDVLSQIRGALVSNFGYGKRAKKWAKYFDNNMESFRVKYQGQDINLVEFINVMKNVIKKGVAIPRDQVYRASIEIEGKEYIIAQDFRGRFFVYDTHGRPVRDIGGYAIRFAGYFRGEPIILLGEDEYVFGYSQVSGFLTPKRVKDILRRLGKK